MPSGRPARAGGGLRSPTVSWSERRDRRLGLGCRADAQHDDLDVIGAWSGDDLYDAPVEALPFVEAPRLQIGRGIRSEADGFESGLVCFGGDEGVQEGHPNRGAVLVREVHVDRCVVTLV